MTGAAEPLIFDEQFSSSTLDPAWTFAQRSGRGRYSLTDNPGAFRYYGEGFRTGQALSWWNPAWSHDWPEGSYLIRAFAGDRWVLRTAVTYHLHGSSGGDSMGAQDPHIAIVFGDGTGPKVDVQRVVDYWYRYDALNIHLQNTDGGDPMLFPDYVSPNTPIDFRASGDTYHYTGSEGWINHTYWYEVARDDRQVTIGISTDGTTFEPARSFTLPPTTGATQRIALYVSEWAQVGSFVDLDMVIVRRQVSGNQPPAVSGITVPATPVAVGTTISAAASFTDAGDTGTHTAVWNWGDGVITAGPVAGGAVSGEHAYASAGIYRVNVTVTDDDGGAGTATAENPIIVYDPEGGSITGGGWIDSPAGAWTSDPAASYRLHFGFAASYQKGTSVPRGQMQVTLEGGDFSFHSSGYDWLVVEDAKVRLGGSGTVNGDGDYGFTLTAVDGQAGGASGPDLFRLRIRDTDTGAVVYDNQVGAGPTADPTSAIGGGSIVLHGNSGTRYRDINGNGRGDFTDIVLYFDQMSSIAANGPFYAVDFDYNGNGRIDFADVVWLFNNL